MAIAFRSGATATQNSGFTSGTSFTITIPSGVQTGDVLILGINAMIAGGGTVTATPTGGPTWHVAGTASHDGSSAFGTGVNSTIWWAAPTTAQAGTNVTIGTSASTECYSALATYTGCNTSAPIDCYNTGNAGTTGGTGSASCPCPTATTVAAGDWAVAFVGSAAAATATYTITYPTSAATARVHAGDTFFALAALSDNATAVGASTGIGGGTWTYGAGTNAASASIIVGLAGAATPVTSNPRPPRITGQAITRASTW